MAVDYTPTTITSGFASVTTLNTQFTAIQTALLDAISRSGNGPNTLSADLDMDSNRILNLPAPVADHEPARKIDQVAGPTGPTGAAGTDGTDGEGVPEGGTAGQVLAKIDGGNYNTEWVTSSGGGPGRSDTLTTWTLANTAGTAPTFEKVAINNSFFTNITSFKFHVNSKVGRSVYGYLEELVVDTSIITVVNMSALGASDEVLHGFYKVSGAPSLSSSVLTVTVTYIGESFVSDSASVDDELYFIFQR